MKNLAYFLSGFAFFGVCLTFLAFLSIRFSPWPMASDNDTGELSDIAVSRAIQWSHIPNVIYIGEIYAGDFISLSRKYSKFEFKPINQRPAFDCVGLMCEGKKIPDFTTVQIMYPIWRVAYIEISFPDGGAQVIGVKFGGKWLSLYDADFIY